MKIYLAGPMRGYPEFNFPAFYRYAAQLREQGHEVFSPAEKDNQRHGKDISKGMTGDLEQLVKTHGFNLREALHDDLSFICLSAEAVALMPGWTGSKGACAEKATADALGLEILYL